MKNEANNQTFRVVANRTEEIRLNFTDHSSPSQIKDFPHKQMQALLLYIVTSCPNLKTLNIE